MAFAEDFTDFFDVDEFGVVATFDGNDLIMNMSRSKGSSLESRYSSAQLLM